MGVELTAASDPSSLRKVALFKAVSEETLLELERRCTWRSYLAGEEIIGYMDQTDDVFFILSGKGRVNIYSPAGRVVGFRELGPGDTFGEFAALDKQPRSASVEAEKDCVVATLRSAEFLRLIDDDRTIMRALMLHLVEQMRALTVRVYEFSTLAVKNRIQADLLRLARDGVLAPNGQANTALITDAPKHAEIAARISTHREAVTRHLNELSRMGLIERQGRALLVKDVQRLEFMVFEATDQ